MPQQLGKFSKEEDSGSAENAMDPMKIRALRLFFMFTTPALLHAFCDIYDGSPESTKFVIHMDPVGIHQGTEPGAIFPDGLVFN